MAIEDYSLEGLSDLVKDGDNVKEIRLKATAGLTNIDRAFTDLVNARIRYQTLNDTARVAEYDGHIEQLKTAMFVIYNKY